MLDMLCFGWSGMLEILDCCLDISRHGYGHLFFVIFPLNGELTVVVTSPIYRDLIFLRSASKR